MRTIPTGQGTIARANNVNHHLKVEVQKADATWYELSTWVKKCEWGRDVDQATIAGTVTFKREVDQATSLAPLMGSSLINRSGGSYSPLLQSGRRIKISMGVSDHGGTPAYWYLGCDGYIDEVDPGPSGEVQIQFRDLGARILDTYVTGPYRYGTAAGRALELVIQDILDMNEAGGYDVTLYTPSTPGWMVKEFCFEEGSVLDQCRALAEMIGWTVRYEFDASENFRLTLFNPFRSPGSPDYTFAASDYSDVPRYNETNTDVRNHIRVKYMPDPPHYVNSADATDSTSISENGRRFMLKGVEETFDIHTEVQAQNLADIILRDLKDRFVDAEKRLWLWPWVQCGDRYAFTANNIQYDSTQTFSVVGFRHEFDGGLAHTTLQLRGNPVGMFRTWIRRSAGGGRDLEAKPRPTLEIYPAVPTTVGNIAHIEAVKLVAHPSAEFTQAALYYRTYTKGDSPSVFTRYPVTAGTYTDDPVIKLLEVTIPINDGAQPVVLEAYAEQENLTYSKWLYREFDGDTIPNGVFELDINQANGHARVAVSTIDTDSGSWRFRTVRGVAGSQTFTDPTYVDTGDPEFKGDYTTFGTSIDITGGVPLLAGQEILVSGYFYRTTTATAVAQQASVKGEVVRVSGIYNAAAAIPVHRVEAEQVTDTGVDYGQVKLTIYDPGKKVKVSGGGTDYTQKKLKVGDGAWDAAWSNMTVVSGTAGTDTVLVRTARVALDPKHNSEIQWQYIYMEGTTEIPVGGHSTFDFDTVAEGTIKFSRNPDGTVNFTLDADEDTTFAYYKFAIVDPDGSYPSVAVSDRYKAIGDLPFTGLVTDTNSDTINIPNGKVLKAKAGFSHAATSGTGVIDSEDLTELGASDITTTLAITLAAYAYEAGDGGEITVSISTPQANLVGVSSWKIWMKLGGSPGTDPLYQIAHEPISNRQYTTGAMVDGTFYFVVQAFDIRGMGGPTTSANVTLSGGGSGSGAQISSCAVVYQSSPQHHVSWNCNSVIDGNPSIYTVEVSQGGWPPNYDTQTVSATTEYTNHTCATRSETEQEGYSWQDWYFTLKLKENGATIQVENLQIAGWYLLIA